MVAGQTVNAGAICVVTAGGPHPWIIINALKQTFPNLKVVVEGPEGRLAFLRRRARRLGWVAVLGQFATMMVIRAGKLVLAGRIRRIIASDGLMTSPSPDQQMVKLGSVNSDAFLSILDDIKPAAILLVGCRMMAAETLARISCPVLNYHAGITPQYRGMNGGYWALATGDGGNFGSTVHLVDPGVDTGPVIAQVRCAPRDGDTIMTYAYTQAAASRQMCVDALILATTRPLVSNVQSEAISRQWYHPSLWQYLRTGMAKGVW
jgi:folate-dependent phosphoribosylglycinamide formyltransferase PurN